MNMIFRVLFVTYWVMIFLNGDQAFAQQSTQVYTYPPSQVHEERLGPLVCVASKSFGQPSMITINFSADIEYEKIPQKMFIDCANGAKKKLSEDPKKPTKKSKDVLS